MTKFSSGLDEKSRKEIFTLLKKLNTEDKTIIFTSHNPEEVASYATDVILLEKGEVKSTGTILDIYSYNPLYMTEGAKLKKMLEGKGLTLGDMDSIEDSIASLTNLLCHK